MVLPRSLLRLSAVSAFGALAQAAYTIQDTYDTTSFFDGFEFYSGADPTNGFVQYHNAALANSSSLAGYANGGIYLGVDSSTENPSAPGRGSIRMNSKKTYTKGLFVADIAHMPTTSKSGCGLWPAFWTFGAEGGWPNAGEIDIIEGVNSASSTTFTLHTSAECSFSQGNCNAGNGNDGCGEQINDTQTYGAGFNEIGGGVYAVEWTSEAISIWFFPRSGSIPSDIAAGNPDPTSWPAATGTFSGSGCDIDSHFTGHQIVFNTDFCGDWAGKVWSEDAVCSTLASTCDAYVAANPSDFVEAFWLINSVKVFSQTTSNQTTSKRDAVPRRFKA
ncbi:concanavalin A-like lectin/glucanase domain-containing protein [Xylariales sp. AK1849]|nr:concanavalin A-like lectin/glucanase domain-containing protein [Xylariales sp. AK1849]